MIQSMLQKNPQTGFFKAQIISCCDGVAKQVRDIYGNIHPVDFITDGMPFLETGDQVMVHADDEGIAVIARLKAPHEIEPAIFPRLTGNNRLILEHAGGELSINDQGLITIRVGEQRISIDSDAIQIHSGTVLLKSEGDMHIQAQEKVYVACRES